MSNLAASLSSYRHQSTIIAKMSLPTSPSPLASHHLFSAISCPWLQCFRSRFIVSSSKRTSRRSRQHKNLKVAGSIPIGRQYAVALEGCTASSGFAEMGRDSKVRVRRLQLELYSQGNYPLCQGKLSVVSFHNSRDCPSHICCA